MTINIFEYATRNKLRFSSPKGELDVERLWDVPLRSKDGFNLNELARTASHALKAVTEENFVDDAKKKTPDILRAELRLEVIKSIIDSKLADEAALKRKADNQGKKEQLIAALARKQEAKLDETSIKDLQRQIRELDDE